MDDITISDKEVKTTLFPPPACVRSDIAAQLVREHWGLELDPKPIKVSQSVTFAATSALGTKYAVRATPVDAKTPSPSADYLFFARWIADAGLQGVCAPVKTRAGEQCVRADGLMISLSPWADGELVDFTALRWLTDQPLAFAWGRWLAMFHAASRAFSLAHPSIAARMQHYDDIHEGTLRGVVVDPADSAVIGDSAHWGLLHGDANISNFFVKAAAAADSPPEIHMFDWDQAQQGWFLADLAQAELVVYMLAEGGEVPSGVRVAHADPSQFESWLVAGYESIAGVGAVDRVRLARLVDMRREFYRRFAARALREGGIPAGMVAFIAYVSRWTTIGGCVAAEASKTSIDS